MMITISSMTTDSIVFSNDYADDFSLPPSVSGKSARTSEELRLERLEVDGLGANGLA